MKTEEIEIGNKGEVLLHTKGILDLLYQGKDLKNQNFLVDNSKDISLYDQFSFNSLDNCNYKFPDLEKRRNTWFYPDEYNQIDLNSFFLSLCHTDVERNRVINEITKYYEKGFEKFLRFCIYFSKIVNDNHLVIGVGRGSSCCSYVLYLLGLHKVQRFAPSVASAN